MPLPDELGYRLHAVDLDPADVRDYYDGFANATLWPLYHDQIRAPLYRTDWWRAYQRVNGRFADAVAATAAPGAAVWAHDYHLQLLPALLRHRRPDVRIGFFLHIPFPFVDLFSRLPWRDEVIAGIAAADVIGVQTPRDVGNFLEAVRRIGGDRADMEELPPLAERVGAFPISVDVERWNDLAHGSDVADRMSALRRRLGNPKALLLGIDRLDYTKGILHRLRAFGDLLASRRLSVPDAVLVQVASPSRDNTAAYRAERSRLEELVGRINGEFGAVGSPAVHYIHQPLGPTEVAALYRASDVMLVTPFHDGMNLVAKEFIATRIANRGVLVLSEFAGAAEELSDALIVNPHHPDAIGGAVLSALAMSPEEVTARMTRLRATVAAHTVHDWAAQFLARLERRAC